MSVTQKQKMWISLLSGLLFFIVANPETFKFVRKILGDWISSPTGCPTVAGLWVHAFVYFLLTWGLMNTGQKEYATGDEEMMNIDDVEDNNSPETDNQSMMDLDTRPIPKLGKKGTTTDVKPYGEDDDDDYDSINLTTMLGGGDKKGTYDKCSCESGKSVVIMN